MAHRHFRGDHSLYRFSGVSTAHGRNHNHYRPGVSRSGRRFTSPVVYYGKCTLGGHHSYHRGCVGLWTDLSQDFRRAHFGINPVLRIVCSKKHIGHPCAGALFHDYSSVSGCDRDGEPCAGSNDLLAQIDSRRLNLAPVGACGADLYWAVHHQHNREEGLGKSGGARA